MPVCVKNSGVKSGSGKQGESVRYVTHETVEQARKVDLLSYLKANSPGELVRCGADEYCTREHDSLKISHGKWYWWSHGVGGASALDYLVKVQNMDFITAVEAVTHQSAVMSKTTAPSFSLPKSEHPKEIYLPRFNYSCTTVRQYLLGRGIDSEVVSFFITRRMIAEDNKTRAALFFGLDSEGKIKQCSMRATDGTSEKKDAAGSDRSYSFQLLSVKENNTLRIFESAIDLMSFATLMKQNGQDFRTENLLSLSGVYMPNKDYAEIKIPSSVERYLEEHPNTKTIYLHLDNDYAGRRGAAGLQYVLGETHDVRFLPPPRGKDFNDYLQLTAPNTKIKQEKDITKNEKQEKETQPR